MKYVEVGAALAALVLRAVALVMRAGEEERPFRTAELAADWVMVLILFWGAVALVPEKPRAKTACLVATCVWLAAIYALHQLHHTFWFMPGGG